VAKQLGAALREARERAGLSQSALGQLAGLAPNMISRIESGERPNPQFATIARIAKAIGVSLDTIAADCGLMPKGGPAMDSGNAIVVGDLLAIAREVANLQERVGSTISKLNRGVAPGRRSRKRG
jgi:transcriptional regulator with XRE-family HTH domain